jgi:hypothetical protein
MISLEIQSVARGISAEMQRRSSVKTLRAGLVSQTILRRGGTFRRAWNRSRQDWGASDDLSGTGLMKLWIFR